MMSWAAEDWTAGLSGLVLQKVQDLQAHNEKLNRERQQRQLQLDNSEAALHKQKQNYDEVRTELSAAQRELVGVREGAQAEARAKERLIQELQAKAAQVCSLENQLESAKSLTQRLTQEVKRLEAELEKLQKESVTGESMLFSTPCWNMNSPWDQNGGKSGLRGEGDKAQNVRQQLLFADSPKPSVGGVSSQFPQQPFKTPSHRRGVHQSEQRTHSSVFPWERDETKSAPRARPPSSPASLSSSDVITTDSELRDSGTEEALRRERDGLCVQVTELQKDLQVEKQRCRETESRLVQAQKELSIKEQNVTRSRDELARAQTRVSQEGERAQTAEQRVKQLQEELKCQRQNAETSRSNAEQRRKDMERDHQKELLELQRERQSMEKQHQQENNRLNQEIQQARTAHNILQAQYDKLALQKQTVERDLEGVQAKLKITQAELTESQKKEAQTLAKLTESLRENEGLNVSLEQLKKREKSLEAEVKRLTEELAEALKLIKELEAQLAAPPPPLISHPFAPITGDSFTPVLSIHHDRCPPQQPLVQKKRAPKPSKPRETDRPGILPYPSDREPGEGIDSEHMCEFESEDTVTLNVKDHEGNQRGTGRPGDLDMESSITEQDTGIEDTDTDSYMSDSTSERMFKDEGFPQTDIHYKSGSKNLISSHQGEKHTEDSSSLKELKKENAALRDELKDVKQELDRRLDDLETQRRAEAEARTKLKQLSKKHSSQAEQHRVKAQEFKDKGSKLEAQLEQERKEIARLREFVSTLEKEAEKRQEEGENEKEESKEENIKLKEALAEMERKEDWFKEEREKMQKDLEAVRSELMQEREVREEEKKRLKNNEMEGLKIAELQAELDRLQRSAGLEDKNIKDNMPLTYLQLGNQSNTIDDVTALENNVVSSPDANVFFCESANLQNTMFSKETRIIPLITECGILTKSAEHSQQNIEDNTSEGDVENEEKYRAGMDLDDTTVLVLEVECLRGQRDKEADRARKSQKKLEVLQNQVTSQTKQLTLAFESQSKHIEDLLVELQERDDALQRQEEELQRCQEQIASLKADKHMREMVNTASNTEQSAVASVESSSNLAISSTISSNHKMFKKDAFEALKDEPLQFDSEPFTNVEVGKDQHGDVKAELGKSHMSDLPVSIREPVSLPTSNEHGGDSHTENTKEKALLEPLTTAQQGRSHVVESNMEKAESSIIISCPDKPTEQSDISEFPQSFVEYPTDEFKKVVNELHKAQNKLSLLKAEHNQLTLQTVSKEDYLSLKQENEQLKLKLNLMAKETSATQNPLPTQETSSHMINTKEEDPAAINQAEHSSSTSSRLEEAVAGGSFGDGERDNKEKGGEEHGECEDETCSSAQVHSIQEQVQTLQSQLQLLSEQNREQAEELELWRLSASSEGETVDDLGSGRPIVLVREDQIVLACSSTGLHTHRTVGQQEDLSQPKCYSGPEPAPAERDNQVSSKKTTGNLLSVLKAKEFVADDHYTILDANNQQRMEILALDANSPSLVSLCETQNSEDCPDVAQQIKQRVSISEAVSVSPANLSNEITFRTEIAEDNLNTHEPETKVLDPNLNTESDTRDLQKSSFNHSMTVSLTQHGDDQNDDNAAVSGRETDNSAQRENWDVIKLLAIDEGERSKTTETTHSLNQAWTKEVKCVSTQTEECSEREVRENGGTVAPQQRVSLQHISTQTQCEEMEGELEQREEEMEFSDISADSPSSSPVPPSEPEKLLYAGAFPIPANPAHLAERIRRNRSRMSAAYDDTEYEPYGLPEVVMKGFADIPSGPACPYVLRRGLLGTDALPLSLRDPLREEAEDDVDP